ncbi:hypothetical protein PAESOLCIP111_05056 [Paenibacillus solanacearum]|uniref:Uncharacterized protein n=1 Tax=Paenibacillus solanacearum TaxID=2048548 RepID=A0A916K5U5_9BACL|nr:hypothetical protein [Paenibacillus solanacearum]CAG7645942.1 hypothetical protein PAESOLCIP111_05056 [Paenibacillus solanacearum]
MIRRFLAMIALLTLLTSWLGVSAWAHNYNNGYSYLHIYGDRVEYEQLLPYPVMLQYDTNGNGAIEEDEVVKQRAAIEAYFLEHLILFNNEQRMDVTIDDVKTVIQEKTEDPMVRVLLNFTSPLEIGNLTILYNLIFEFDDTHQNYIVLSDANDTMLEHWVVEKGAGSVRYMPDNKFRFDLSLMAQYAVLGAQKMLFSVYCWLLLLFVLLTAPTVREAALSLGIGTLYTLLGLIVTDRLGVNPLADWLHPAALVLFALFAVYTVFAGRGAYPKVVSALFGLAWGTGSVSLIQSLYLNHQFKVVSLVFYYLGVALAWGGLLYVLYIGISPFLRSSRFGKKARALLWRNRSGFEFNE